MLLDSFFLRYKADTGQAVKDVNALDAAEDKRAKNKKKNEQDEGKSGDKKKKQTKDNVDDVKKAGKAQEELQKVGKKSFDELLAGGGKFGELLGKLGPAGIAAAVGVAAIAAAIGVAVAGVEDAREAAKEAITLGDKAYEARLAQGELIRLQNQGRRRGIGDEETSKSAKGVSDKGSEIRAAQRQAARDPASGFNNPLIKAGNLFKKAGVDVNAALGTQIEQQDKYLRALVATGQEERALVEGVELFGRSLHDVRSVLSTTAEESGASALVMAKENNLRRDLQKSSESLSATEGKLEAVRKKNDEQILSKTVPATEDFSKALIQWEEAIAPLKATWGDFVASLIEGLASLVKKAASFVEFFTWSSDDHTPEQNKSRAVEEAGDKAETDARIQLGRGGATTQAEKDRIAAARKKAEDEAAAKFDTTAKTADEARKPAIAGQIDKGVEELVTKKDGKQFFEGREVSSSDVEAAKKSAQEAIEKDASVDEQKETNAILRDMLNKTAEAGKVQEAQTQLTKKIESNTTPLVNTGLEQAMALWAGGMGKAGGVDSVKFQGEDRGSYEGRVNQMRKTINPNTVTQGSEARTLGKAPEQTPNKSQNDDRAVKTREATTPPIPVAMDTDKVPAAPLPPDTKPVYLPPTTVPVPLAGDKSQIPVAATSYADNSKSWAPPTPPALPADTKPQILAAPSAYADKANAMREATAPTADYDKEQAAALRKFSEQAGKLQAAAPNVGSQVNDARSTANNVGQQAAAINSSAPSSAPAGGNGGGTTFGDINVEVTTKSEDGESVGRDIGTSLANELSFAHGNNLSPRVS